MVKRKRWLSNAFGAAALTCALLTSATARATDEALLRSLEAVSSIPRPTSGESPTEPSSETEPRHRTREEREEKEILAGVKLTLSLPFTREEGREETFVGGALFFERSLIPGVLEIELSVGYGTTVKGDSRYVAPFDLLLKHPFHVSPVINPYLGAGIAMNVERYDGHTEVLLGIPVVVGCYFWWNRHVGLDVEIGSKVLFHEHVTWELELAIGPVFHF